MKTLELLFSFLSVVLVGIIFVISPSFVPPCLFIAITVMFLDYKGVFKRINKWYKEGMLKARVRRKEYIDFVQQQRSLQNYKVGDMFDAEV